MSKIKNLINGRQENGQELTGFRDFVGTRNGLGSVTLTLVKLADSATEYELSIKFSRPLVKKAGLGRSGTT